MHVSLFRIDAFTDTIFSGNPAAVCPLASWPEKELLQAIAAENNLSETAYLVPQGDNFALRWFTPKCEVNLCGHATLASGFVILNILHPRSRVCSLRNPQRQVDCFARCGAACHGFPCPPPAGVHGSARGAR